MENGEEKRIKEKRDKRTKERKNREPDKCPPKKKCKQESKKIKTDPSSVRRQS